MFTTESLQEAGLGEFRPVVQQLKRQLAPRGLHETDRLAQDWADYEAILYAHAWMARSKWRAVPSRVSQGPKAERFYIYGSLWRKARSIQRDRNRKKNKVELQPFFDQVAEDDFGWRVECRQDLAKGIKRLRREEWDALVECVCGGHGGGYTWRERRLARQAKSRLRKFLAN